MSIKRATKSTTPPTSASRSASRPEESRCKSIAAVIDNRGLLRWRASRDRCSGGFLCEWIVAAKKKPKELLMPSHQTGGCSERKQKKQRRRLDEERNAVFNKSADLSTYPRTIAVRTTQATASPRAGKRNIIGSGEHQPHGDIVARRVRVRTRRVRLLDEHIGLGAGTPREANPEFDLDPESLRCRSHTDAGFDFGIRRERNVLARRHEPHRSQKGRCVASCEQLLRIGPAPARAAQLAWRDHIQIQAA